ncbi:hypothetical protein L2E82_15305 [Cichorium intybus]|uniref:Uncharacterized protein n=1 Tax=Cichorium intybus TaxID=13427 RepID=A0ACB9F2Z4_CICIN|nr:hypothetical protein L2E82_15305 [Cichorium intybus]
MEKQKPKKTRFNTSLKGQNKDIIEYGDLSAMKQDGADTHSRSIVYVKYVDAFLINGNTFRRRTKLSPLEKFGNVLSYDSRLNSEAISATTSLIWVDGYASRYRAFGSH